MINIGKINHLQIVKSVDFGIYLDGEEAGEILLPLRYVPAGCTPGDSLEVFIYRDSEDRLIATTETPYAMVDQCAYLKVVAINRIGAFLDWGLPKDLLVPFSEQRKPMQVDNSYVVFLYLDGETDRIAASTREAVARAGIPELGIVEMISYLEAYLLGGVVEFFWTGQVGVTVDCRG